MPVYAIKTFRRFQRKQRIGDVALMEAIERAEAGLVDGDLGGGLIKQRIARPGKGRSGSDRTIIAYRAGERAVFLLGFAKSALDDIDSGSCHQVSSDSDMLSLLQAGAGVGFLPQSLPLPGELRRLHVSDAELGRTIHLYAVAGRPRPATAGALMSLLRTADWSRHLH